MEIPYLHSSLLLFWRRLAEWYQLWFNMVLLLDFWWVINAKVLWLFPICCLQILLFYEVEHNQVRTMRALLLCLEVAGLGLKVKKVNFDKSELVLVCNSHNIHLLAGIIGCKVSSLCVLIKKIDLLSLWIIWGTVGGCLKGYSHMGYGDQEDWM